jgi:hypothetical protein
MLPDTSAEHVDRDNRYNDDDDLRGRLGVLEAADAFVKRLTDSPPRPRCRASLRSALMFVVAVGMGPFAGVMAIFVHNLGVFEALLRGGRINHASCKTSYSASCPR